MFPCLFDYLTVGDSCMKMGVACVCLNGQACQCDCCPLSVLFVMYETVERLRSVSPAPGVCYFRTGPREILLLYMFLTKKQARAH